MADKIKACFTPVRQRKVIRWGKSQEYAGTGTFGEAEVFKGDSMCDTAEAEQRETWDCDVYVQQLEMYGCNAQYLPYRWSSQNGEKTV